MLVEQPLPGVLRYEIALAVGIPFVKHGYNIDIEPGREGDRGTVLTCLHGIGGDSGAVDLTEPFCHPEDEILSACRVGLDVDGNIHVVQVGETRPLGQAARMQHSYQRESRIVGDVVFQPFP